MEISTSARKQISGIHYSTPAMANKRPRESCEPQKTAMKTTKPKTKKKKKKKKEKKKMTRRRCTRGTSITVLPDHVLSLIFIKLPARSIPVLRSVCKSWRSLTSSTTFVLSHARRACTTSVVLACRRLNLYQLNHSKLANLYHLNHSKLAKRVVLENQTLTKELTEKISKFSHLSLLASCDGLLCFEDNDYIRRTNYLVCNLLTKDFIGIVEGTVHIQTLLHAFYFHPPTGEYRLLQHHSKHYLDGPLASYGYEVFGLGGTSRVWRPIEASCYIARCISRDVHLARSCRQIALHGNIHWPPLPSYLWIIVFDTISENFRQMSVARLHQQPCFHHLIEMGGSLGYCQLHWEQMEIWYLKDYAEEEWIKQYTIPVHEIRKSPYSGQCYPLAIWNSGKEILLSFLNNHFFLYNFTSKTFRKQKIYKSREILCNWTPHRETLISPCCLGSRDT